MFFRVFVPTCYCMFCHRLVAVFLLSIYRAYFVADLLQVIVSSTIDLFVIFALTVQMTKFDPTESPYQSIFINIL